MIFWKISADMKEHALHLLTEGWELPEIADVLSVSLKSIGRWADNYNQHGTVIPPSYHQGQRRLLNAEAISGLKELIDKSPELYLNEIGEWLALYHDIPMSTTALDNNLCDLGITQKIMHQQAAECNHASASCWVRSCITYHLAAWRSQHIHCRADGCCWWNKQGREDSYSKVWLCNKWTWAYLHCLTQPRYPLWHLTSTYCKRLHCSMRCRGFNRWRRVLRFYCQWCGGSFEFCPCLSADNDVSLASLHESMARPLQCLGSGQLRNTQEWSPLGVIWGDGCVDICSHLPMTSIWKLLW